MANDNKANQKDSQKSQDNSSSSSTSSTTKSPAQQEYEAKKAAQGYSPNNPSVRDLG